MIIDRAPKYRSRLPISRIRVSPQTERGQTSSNPEDRNRAVAPGSNLSVWSCFRGSPSIRKFGGWPPMHRGVCSFQGGGVPGRRRRFDDPAVQTTGREQGGDHAEGDTHPGALDDPLGVSDGRGSETTPDHEGQVAPTEQGETLRRSSPGRPRVEEGTVRDAKPSPQARTSSKKSAGFHRCFILEPGTKRPQANIQRVAGQSPPI